MNTTDLPLRDIHLPAEVGIWPLAVGWYLLLALIVIIALLLWLWQKHRRSLAWQQQAMAELQHIRQDFAQQHDTQRLAIELSALLRRAALYNFPEQPIAALQGRAWLDFLNGVSPVFDNTIIHAPYAPQPILDEQQLLTSCQNWLQQLPKQRRR